MPGIVGSLPNNIANGQIIDAGPVMANFNWLMNQVNANAASLAGANVFAQAITAPVATVGTQLATAAQVQNNENYAADSGVVNAYICAPSIPVLLYAQGQQFMMTTANTNTLTNPTLAISALAALPIVNQDGSALMVGQITAGIPFTYTYDSALVVFRISLAITKTAPGKLPTVTATVAASALTIGLTPQYVDFRSATLGSGTVSTIAAAPANIVVPGSATLGTTNAVAARLAVAAMNNAGTVELAVANMLGLTIDEAALISTTALSGGATSAAVWYSTTLRSNLPFRIVGHIDITEATAGTWATAPSTIQSCATVTKLDSTMNQVFTATGAGTWTKPIGLTGNETVEVEMWGGGGGGSATSGGGGGGGAYCRKTFAASALSATVALSVGTGGSAGVAGGNSSFGATLVTAFGGGGGSTIAPNGGGGGGTKSAGGNGTSSGGTAGAGYGVADVGGVGDSITGTDWGGGSGGATNTTNGGNSLFGGGGGGGASGGVSLFGGAGGSFNGGAGVAPGGGGAAGNGVGGRGEIRVRVYSLNSAF